MRKIVFIWSFPHVAGVPWEEVIVKKRAKKYCEQLNEYFMNDEMDWQASLDTTYGDLDSLLKSDYEMFLFAPGGEKRFWSYKKELEKSGIFSYYLTEMELYNGDIARLVKAMDSF